MLDEDSFGEFENAGLYENEIKMQNEDKNINIGIISKTFQTNPEDTPYLNDKDNNSEVDFWDKVNKDSSEDIVDHSSPIIPPALPLPSLKNNINSSQKISSTTGSTFIAKPFKNDGNSRKSVVLSKKRPINNISPLLVSNSTSPRSLTVPSSPQNVITIESFDPNDPKTITESLSLQALSNLGLSLKEISYPKLSEMKKYTQDKELYEVIFDRLKQRVDKTITFVKNERERILRSKQTQSNQISSRNCEQDNSSYLELERRRIQRLQETKKKVAEQMIYSLLVEHENLFENEERKKIEEEKRRIHDEKLKQMSLFETQVAEEKRIRLEEKRLEQFKKSEEAALAALKFEEDFKKKQEEEAAKRKLEAEEIEKLRKTKLEELRKKKIEEEEIAKREFEEKKALIEKRERDYLAKLEEQKKERIEKAIETENRINAQVIKAQQFQELERTKKTENSLKKVIKHEEELRKREHERKQKIIEMVLKEKAKEEKVKKNRDNLEITDHVTKLIIAKEKEEKSEAAIKDQRELIEKKRSKSTLLNQIKIEDHKATIEMSEKQRETIAKESENHYCMTLKRIEAMELLRKQKFRESEALRSQLEEEKMEILKQSAIAQRNLRNQSPEKIKQIAEKMGIDFDSLQAKAKQKRRSKHSSTLPSIIQE